MADSSSSRIRQARTWFVRGFQPGGRDCAFTHDAQVGITTVVVLVLYGLLGYFGLPILLRHIATGQLAAAPNRPLTVGRIGFNPYRLRLDIDQLHLGGRDGSQPFVDVGRLRVKVSWTSLFRIAPVVGEVVIDEPRFISYETRTRALISPT